ncbi:dUTP diphosphatase [Kolpuevirus frurule]|uniref:dUTP diphosphatase n=1 Tax=Kolpuevirus sp. 'frurule' TaxID=3028514 RepID=A0AAF0DPQ9_9CAUD|nr:dUTP diphosphatase [Kolpuevirus sp. 'frurule']
MKIKYRLITEGCNPYIHDSGDWFDLRAAETVSFKAPQAGVRKRETIDGEIVSHRDVTFDFKLIKLGVAMQLSKGFEATILPRSSTPGKLGVICANSQAVIDNSYCGDEDEWRFPAIAFRDTTINKGERICQFRIQLSQKATIWQKLRWLFSNKIELVSVDKLESINRGGFGTTGVK